MKRAPSTAVAPPTGKVHVQNTLVRHTQDLGVLLEHLRKFKADQIVLYIITFISMGKLVLSKPRFNLRDYLCSPNQSRESLGAGAPKFKHGPSHQRQSSSSTCDEAQQTASDTTNTEGIWRENQKSLGLAYKPGAYALTMGRPDIFIIRDGTGDPGPPISPNRSHRKPEKRPVAWKDEVRKLEIRQGPLCRNRVNGMLCYHPAYVFKEDGPEEDYFEKIVASQKKIMRRSLSKGDATLFKRMARRILNKDGGSVPVLTCGIYLCGFKETELSPRLVVSCNGILSIPSLMKEFHGADLRSSSSYDEWLTYEVTLKFPDTNLKPRMVAKGTGTLEESETVANTEYVPEHVTTAEKPDSIPTGTDDSPEPICFQPESLEDPWKVYADDCLSGSRDIRLPKRVYIGQSPDKCTVATIGGLIEFEGHAKPYGLTVGHALNQEDNKNDIVSDVSSGPALPLEDDYWAQSGGSMTRFTMIGRVAGNCNPSESDSDWAVVKFENEFQIFSSITPAALSGPRFAFPRDMEFYHKEVTVHCGTSILRGLLGPYPYLIHALDSPYWLVTYPIKVRLPEFYRAGKWHIQGK